MEVSKIISNSFKYPFRNIKKLPILFVLFVLVALVPIGIVSDNRYVLILGIIAFFLFILIVPGYLLSIVNIGLNESSVMPSLNFGKNIYDTIRLFLLRIVYMLVPTAVFFIAWFTLGVSGMDMLYKMDITGFLLAMGLTFLIILIVYVLFEILLFFAKARLAYLNSLSEALKIHNVVIDIKNIGIFNIIKWLVFMAILMVVVSFVSSWILAIPYVGFIIYLGIIIPILESIGNYSLGLLYSNIAQKEDELDRFEREVQLFKYFN
ncbi:DUF4013 domain-containing protein [Methanobrevibacter sp.]|uniref:DUF4013 domain-containing protein n=1 Tax=Methanobrevibacter sp. TaxID=66852 RepID=UPI0026E10C55|nr:DUF4013 domain-containing protein [Methanobrevibacter sp.]MDO5860086.1 DUF4013 domain-containing protein [Methanobrevibacter sp.]